ncbi:GAF domain-containing sensor histidine kinase [Microcoleus sp. FACHB-1515]|uniref:sensor histidine kinase n=1 Tax=Cyanophyceae TaxID=3028117 RepID=UPI001687ADEA|nr:ATP-binding protein [Microcoleus sp. FACHB-1515]MBD2088376.1 GAF domain-containing sensor histidine kinase [Microcoleus sp. FACHB-1515]
MLPSLLEQLRPLCRDEAAFVQMQAILNSKFEQLHREQDALSHVIAKIRASLDLETIFKTTAIEVRQLLDADRVAVFRFDPESGWSSGEFVSEAVLPQFSAALAAQVCDYCFGDRFAADYHRGRAQIVEDIYAANLSDCHIAILGQFQVRANLVVPLIKGFDLWGLLCVHQCHAPRRWRSNEIKFAMQIADELGVALQQAELLQQSQQQADELSEALTTLQNTQMQLIQSEKMSGLGELVAGIAHEINNPVNFIYGNLNHATQYASDLLKLLALYQQSASPDEIAACAEAIDLPFLMRDFPQLLGSMQIGAQRIRQIVLSLRNFSRLDEAEVKPVDIHEGIESTLLILQYRLKAKAGTTGIRILTDYGNLPLVECYPSQLNQVFMNLISNAIDALSEIAAQPLHSCPYCQITIRTRLIERPAGNMAAIEISDNGPGIPAHLMPKLFNTFFTTKPLGKGTGLGLSISRQIVVDRHGGELRCISEVGQGTTFAIEIPIQQSEGGGQVLDVEESPLADRLQAIDRQTSSSYSYPADLNHTTRSWRVGSDSSTPDTRHSTPNP